MIFGSIDKIKINFVNAYFYIDKLKGSGQLEDMILSFLEM